MNTSPYCKQLSKPRLDEELEATVSGDDEEEEASPEEIDAEPGRSD